MNRSQRCRTVSKLRMDKSDRNVVPLLKELVVLNRTQRKYGEPEVPDVPQLHLKRDKVYSFRVNQPSVLINTSTTLNTSTALNFSLG